MANQSIKPNFTSEIDLFLQAFDQKHPSLSLSQQIEIEKSQRIAQLRDHETAPSTTHHTTTIEWKDF